MNEGGIVAASAQSPHTMGRNMVRLQGAGPAHQPGVPILAPGSPGDQAIHGAATVVISDPIVIDAETAGARCGDLSGGESSLRLGPPQVQQPGRSSVPPTRVSRPRAILQVLQGPPRSLNLTPGPSPKYQLRLPRVGPPPTSLPALPLSTCLAAEKTTLWIGGVPCTLRVALAVRGSKEDSFPALSFRVPAPRVLPAGPHTKHRDVHVDVGHGALLQLAEELLPVDAATSAPHGPPRESPRAPSCGAHSPP